MEPQQFGEFAILGKLGQGAMGAVYKARQTSLNRIVALKLLPAHYAGDPDFLARFKNEAMAAASLNHPNIVQVYAAGEDAGTHFFAMEYVEGESLGARLERKGRIDAKEAIAIACHLAQALDYAWRKARVIHRDIKPDNIFLSREGTVKLGDLGLAKVLGNQGGGLTQTGAAMGTPYYVSPEQAMGKREIDIRADIYSLGCTLFHIISGQPPYRGESAMSVMLQHISQPAPRIQAVWPACPPALIGLLDRMLRKRPEERHESYAALLEQLFRVAERLDQSVSSAAGAASLIVPMPAAHSGSTQDAAHPAAAAARSSTASPPPAAGGRWKIPAMIAGIAATVAALLIWQPWKKPPSPGGGSGTVQAEPWVRMFDQSGFPSPQIPFAMQKNWEVRDGWVMKRSDAKSTTTHFPLTMRDGAVRAELRGVTTTNHERLRFRDGITNSRRYGLARNQTGVVLLYQAPNEVITLKEVPVAAAKDDEPYTLELRAIGRRLTVKLDGRELFTVEDDRLDQGLAGVSLPLGSAIRNLEMLNLDGAAVSSPSPDKSAPPITPTTTPTIQTSPTAAAKTIAEARKDLPFVNSLGMKFVPVPITGGPTDKQRVLFSVWETRVQDYEVFATETKRAWPKPDFEQGPTHPAVNVSWSSARAFCIWLTERDFKAGKLRAREHYRLPSDHEWSCALGIGEQEDASDSPTQKHKKLSGIFPWGTAWPPPTGAGNYAGIERDGYATWSGTGTITGYRDGFVHTAPVGSFPANPLGLFDLSGNAWEWCEDLFDPAKIERVLRGSGAFVDVRNAMLSSHRIDRRVSEGTTSHGFRCVLDAGGPVVTTVAPPTPPPAPAQAPTQTAGSNLKSPAVVPGEALTFGGHRYLFVAGKMKWDDAKAKTEAMGGHLATITSKEENDWVIQTFGPKVEPVERFWLGGFAPERDQPWRWVTGEPFTFAAWLPIQSGIMGGNGKVITPNVALALMRHRPPSTGCSWVGTFQADDIPVGFLVEWDDAGNAAAARPAASVAATKDAPFVNTLGMKFVPVPISGGPTDKQRVLFSVWEARVQDYQVFADETKRAWPKPDFTQGPTHPAVNVSWDDAQSFCAWLTERERKAGKLGAKESYRLPADHEWSCAVGIGDREDASWRPMEKANSPIQNAFPWGSQWPPPIGSGNYADKTAAKAGSANGVIGARGQTGYLTNYDDGFPYTSPVGSHTGNRWGIYDLGGNVWEWCEERYNPATATHVLRGASWTSVEPGWLLSSTRSENSNPRDERNGFRVVLAQETAK